jgi:uncharacterized membrane protein HdeD (DUF308 family)
MSGNTSRRSADVFVGREWIVLLRGVIAIAFGALAVTIPFMAQAKLVKLFGYTRYFTVYSPSSGRSADGAG